MGRIIVFEGIDGSGKTTQFRLLCSALTRRGIPFRTLDFPRYGKPSCALVEQYLAGEFGSKPGDVNPWMASAFFAVDRAASWLEDWRRDYQAGALFLTNRYTTSNLLHQGAKLPEEEREPFFRWIYEFEFHRLGLPAPDAVLYMDTNLPTAQAQLRGRQMATGTSGDIHETDGAYLERCLRCGQLAAELFSWRRISCLDGARTRTPEEIHREVLKALQGLLTGNGAEPCEPRACQRV